MDHLCKLVVGLSLILVTSGTALARCGDITGDGSLTASDAFLTLRIVVGHSTPSNCSCVDCGAAVVAKAPRHCADVNGNSELTVHDALAQLRLAVGFDVVENCSCEACEDPATTTTTTSITVPDCLAEGALDGLVFNRKERCVVLVDFPSCPESQLTSDVVVFEHTSGDHYLVRNVPDTGYVYAGNMDCRTFVGASLLPDDRDEIGRWFVQGAGSLFTGTSMTRARADRAPRSCNVTAAKVPQTPSDPRDPGRCPLP